MKTGHSPDTSQPPTAATRRRRHILPVSLRHMVTKIRGTGALMHRPTTRIPHDIPLALKKPAITPTTA
ncbi:hypothetical protein [Microviridae sp.]|nr:hypothetical protein [Microviridae sp.]UOF78489.1 hypothetical protein [Microviridae sp.]